MSERWGAYEDTAKLRERITVIETNLPLLRAQMDRQAAEMDRQFRQLSEGQTLNRNYTEEKFDELAILIRSATPAKAANDKLFNAVLAVGAIATLIFIMLIVYWLWVLTGGHVV
ncbi:MAG: hypothetical protein DMF06_03265 [Verrucomicrobia bacterium]|nr:MAG: hypothetical protein DMF06_03265 [Verrucomicrobiota bacterium]